MFRVFLNITKEEIDTITIDDYIYNCIMLDEVLKLKANITLPRIQ